MNGRARRYLLDVEISAPLPGPGIGPANVGRGNSDDAQHGLNGKLQIVIPNYEAVLYFDYLFVMTDSAAAEPTGHGAVGPAKTSKSEGLDRYLADVDRKHLSRLGPVDVNAATGGIAAPQLALQQLLIGMRLDPGAPVHLGLYLKLLACVHMKRRLVVGSGLEIKYFFRCDFHGNLPLIRPARRSF